MRLRVTHRSVTVREGGRLVAHYPGDTFDGSEKLLNAFGDRLERTGGEPEQGTTVTTGDVQAVLDANASEAEAMLPELSNDQLAELSGLETRKGVSKAVAEEQAAR